MMISPSTYIENLKEKSYEELLKEKKALNDKIEKFESSQNNQDNQDKSTMFIIHPSPEVVYQCNLEYMAKLCSLIVKKYREEKLI